jgi:hypothetical protein
LIATPTLLCGTGTPATVKKSVTVIAPAVPVAVTVMYASYFQPKADPAAGVAAIAIGPRLVPFSAAWTVRPAAVPAASVPWPHAVSR